MAEAAKQANRFKPGQVSWNKGMADCPTGRHPNTRATQFKPGHTNANEMPVGSYRINPDGYLEYKFAQVTGHYYLRWIPVHRKVWTEAHGPVPKGHAVVFRGPRTTVLEEITLDRLELVTQAELMRRNTVWNRYPKEVADVVRLRGALTRQINRREKADRQADNARNATHGMEQPT